MLVRIWHVKAESHRIRQNLAGFDVYLKISTKSIAFVIILFLYISAQCYGGPLCCSIGEFKAHSSHLYSSLDTIVAMIHSHITNGLMIWLELLCMDSSWPLITCGNSHTEFTTKITPTLTKMRYGFQMEKCSKCHRITKLTR